MKRHESTVMGIDAPPPRVTVLGAALLALIASLIGGVLIMLISLLI